MTTLANHPDAALSFSEVVVLKGDSDVIDRFATNPAAPRTFDLSDLPVYLSSLSAPSANATGLFAHCVKHRGDTR